MLVISNYQWTMEECDGNQEIERDTWSHSLSNFWYRLHIFDWFLLIVGKDDRRIHRHTFTTYCDDHHNRRSTCAFWLVMANFWQNYVAELRGSREMKVNKLRWKSGRVVGCWEKVRWRLKEKLSKYKDRQQSIMIPTAPGRLGNVGEVRGRNGRDHKNRKIGSSWRTAKKVMERRRSSGRTSREWRESEDWTKLPQGEERRERDRGPGAVRAALHEIRPSRDRSAPDKAPMGPPRQGHVPTAIWHEYIAESYDALKSSATIRLTDFEWEEIELTMSDLMQLI